MIRSRKELKFYIKADEIMNEQVFPQTWWRKILLPSPIRKFLKTYRKCEFYKYKAKRNKLYALPYLIYMCKYEKWKRITGFDIPLGVLGYGVRIGHCSPIIINGNTEIGNYCCLQNSITIGDGNKKIFGDDVYIASNVTIAKGITIPNGSMISANSFVNKSVDTEYCLIGGVPAKVIKQTLPWTEEQPYKDERERCEKLKKEMGL